MASDAERLVTLFRALGDATRFSIFELLMEGTYCNCEMGETLNLPTNLVSHHLKVLREADLVVAERHPEDGRWILYSINRETLGEARKLVGELLNPARIGSRSPSSCSLVGEGRCGQRW